MGILSAVALVAGLLAVLFGAEYLIRGGVGIARRTGLSPVVIGLTVVAFGTSAPELAIALDSVLEGEADLALGNVVGSNIANVLLVLGLSALIGGTVAVHRRIIRIDVPLVIAVSSLVFVLSLGGELGRAAGVVLIAVLIGYLVWTLRTRPDGIGETVEGDAPGSLPRALVLVGVGLALLVIGARLVVAAAVDIAEWFGIDELVIGLTIVAVGTSVPEIATAVVAVRRGQGDLAVGNVIGSNLFNLLVVLGLSASLAPQPIAIPASARWIDLPIMIAAAVACLPLFAYGQILRRWEGGMFVAFYATYIVWLLLDATGHRYREGYAVAMVGFVIPLTTITIAVIVARRRQLMSPVTR